MDHLAIQKSCMMSLFISRVVNHVNVIFLVRFRSAVCEAWLLVS